jgi:MraZ protein
VGQKAIRIPIVNKMPDDVTTAQIYYNSLFRHGVDQKRRVQIPAKWLPGEESVEFTLILWPKSSEGPCLRVLPPKEMGQLMESIDAMPNSDPSKTVLKRFIGSESVQVATDKTGRICLPEGMTKTAGIKDEAVLVGLLDRFEIWTPERYEKVKAADAVMAQEAFKLME